MTTKGTTMNATATPKQRRKPGPKPKHPGGRRDQQARATLNGAERELHEAWLRTQGWPNVPEVEIVRGVLAEKWAQVPTAA